MTKMNFTVTKVPVMSALQAALFVHCANGYESEIRICETSVDRDAKSLTEVLALNIRKGKELEMSADGPDEAAALDMLVAKLA